MSKIEFEGISDEDFKRFEELLVRFYQKPWEESYAQFTKEIRARFVRKDIRPSLRPHFINNMNELVGSVVSRFIKINSKLERAGKQIDSFYGMLEDRIYHVCQEEIRKLSRESYNVDDSEIPTQTESIDKTLENDERRAIAVRCYRKCFEQLPAHIQDIFREYYEVEHLSPSERSKKRQVLAIRVANVDPQEVTPKQLRRLKNNLESMICKWRTKHLDPCKERCLRECFDD